MGDDESGGEKRIWTRAFLVVAQFLAPAAVLLLGLFLTEDRDPWLIALLTVAVAAVVSTVCAVVVSRYYANRAEAVVRRMEATIGDIGHALLIQAEGRDGLTQEELSKYESRIDVETIWIVGQNFDSEVARAAPFLKTVHRNIHERKIEYVYIAPEAANLYLKFKRLRDELDLLDGDSRLQTLFLPDDDWRKIPYTAGNFVIYDPMRKGHVPQGFCWDPGGDGESFIELRSSVTTDWVEKILRVCEELREQYYGVTAGEA